MEKLLKLWAYTSRNNYLRYLKLKGLTIGKNVYFVNPLHTHVDINRAKFISIGDECVICSGTSLIAHDYSWTIPMKAFSKPYASGGGTIRIGNNCFIGENTIVLKNVSIGDNVIIGAGSLVNKNCEDNSVYAGNPAKKIMTLKEYSLKLEKKCEQDLINNLKVCKKENSSRIAENKMMNFSFLFLERNEENIEKIKKMSWIGCDKKRIVDIFKNTIPLQGIKCFKDLIIKYDDVFSFFNEKGV